MQNAQATTGSPSLWTKEFVLLSVANLFLFFSFQMLIPTLPIYVTQMGGDELAVGLVISVFTVSALLVRPVAGLLLDRVGRRQVLLFGAVVFLACVAGYYFAAAVAVLLFLRFVHGIGWGALTTAYSTVVADIIPAHRRGEGMGYFGLSSTLGMMLAPLIGLYLVDAYGFGVMFVTATVLAALSLVLAQAVRIPAGTPAPAGAETSVWANLFEKKALFPALLAWLLSVTYGGIVSFITLYGAQQGIANVGWFFLGNAGTMLVTRPLSGKLFDKKGHVWVLLPGAFAVIAGLWVISVATNEWTLLVASVLFGLGMGSVQPSLLAWTINRVAPHRRGAANGTIFSAFDGGIAVGAMLLGAVAKVTGYAVMYRWSALFMVAFLAIYLYYVWSGKESKVA